MDQAEPEPAATSLLCWKCFRLLRKRKRVKTLTSDEAVTFNRTWKHLLEKSRKGCEFCILISSSLQFKRDGPFKVDGIPASTFAKNIEFRLRDGDAGQRDQRPVNTSANLAEIELLRVDIRVRDEGNLNLQWEQIEEFNVAANEGNPAASYINRRPRIYDLASRRSFQIAKEWLTNCGNLHDNCPQLKPVPLPTRVIDVGTSTSNQQKLITTNGISGYYSALSYCWGAELQPLVTTQSNIQTLYVDVPTPSLAKTIQEAIFVTRQIGLRYIWIDAFCIIQDSPADQDAEIKRMGEIYETATVTIVAASATHCKQGFLQRRSYPWGVQEWRSFKLPFLCPNGKLGELILEPTDPYFTGDQPINHRGWTMQEFILPSRKLIYSTTQLIWHCLSVHTELGNKARRVDSTRKDLIKVQMLPMLPSSNASLSPPTQQPTLETLHDVRFNWQILVQNYTSRSLTKREDVLPGISGIAFRFACFLSEEYKAGLWYSESNKLHFIENLCWSVQKHTGLSSSDSVQSNVYTAPSWSWAGQPDPISWQSSPDFLAQEDMVCSIEECSVQLAGTAPFGRVKSGILKVRALTRKLGSIGNGDLDDLQCMVNLLEEENISVFLDASTKNLAARFAPGPLWCILLTVYGGLLIMPLDEKWVRIGIFYEKSAMPTGHTFGGWIQDLEFEELTIV